MFAPYHFQRISALETIGTLLAVCQVQALFILNISECGAEETTEGSSPQETLFVGLNFPQILIFL